MIETVIIKILSIRQSTCFDTLHQKYKYRSIIHKNIIIRYINGTNTSSPNKNGGYNLIGVTMNVISFSGQDDNSITFSTKVNLSVANSMNDIAKSDF